jgi:hypothetical protein
LYLQLLGDDQLSVGLCIPDHLSLILHRGAMKHQLSSLFLPNLKWSEDALIWEMMSALVWKLVSGECRTGSNDLIKPSTLALVVGALAHRSFLFLDLLLEGCAKGGGSVLVGER